MSALSTPYKWVGPKLPVKTWNRKKDMPVPLWGFLAIRIDFGLHGIAYTYRHGSKLQLTNGEWCPVFMATLTTPGQVIGMRDAEAAKHRPWAEEWRHSFHDRNLTAMGFDGLD